MEEEYFLHYRNYVVTHQIQEQLHYDSAHLKLPTCSLQRDNQKNILVFLQYLCIESKLN